MDTKITIAKNNHDDGFQYQGFMGDNNDAFWNMIHCIVSD